MISGWQERRCKLNHDWLVNTFLNRLQAFLGRLRSSGSEPEDLRRFLVEDWGTWTPRRECAEALLDDFENEMSPRTLLDSTPLSRIPELTRTRLGEAVHELWFARTAARELVEVGRTRLAAAQLIFLEISDELGDLEKTNLSTLPSHIDSFGRFLAACRDFSRALSVLPGEVRVV